MEINTVEAWTILKAFRDMAFKEWSSYSDPRRNLDAEEQLKGRILAAMSEIADWFEKDEALHQLEDRLWPEASDDPAVLKLEAERKKIVLERSRVKSRKETGLSMRQQVDLLRKDRKARVRAFAQQKEDLLRSTHKARAQAFEKLWRKATGFDYCREDLIRPWRENRQNPVEKKGDSS